MNKNTPLNQNYICSIGADVTQGVPSHLVPSRLRHGVKRVLGDGFGFGSDFRVYERGHFGEKGAKFLIFGLNEGQQEKMGNLQKKIEQITQMGKEPIIAVIERRGEVIYYKINRMNFYENKNRVEKSFQI